MEDTCSLAPGRVNIPDQDVARTRQGDLPHCFMFTDILNFNLLVTDIPCNSARIDPLVAA